MTEGKTVSFEVESQCGNSVTGPLLYSAENPDMQREKCTSSVVIRQFARSRAADRYAIVANVNTESIRREHLTGL